MDDRAEDRLRRSYAKHYARVLPAPAGMQAGTDPMESVRRWLPGDDRSGILDVGCGRGERLKWLAERGFANVRGIDASQAMLELARAAVPGSVDLSLGDATAIMRRSPGKYHLIMMFHVLEHMTVAEALELLDACREQLDPQGRLVVEVPNLACIPAVQTFFSDITHRQGYTEYSLAQLMEGAGLRPELACDPPLVTWRPWRPRGGTTLGWHANRWLHRIAYMISNAGPRPRCVCPRLLMTGKP